jgi:hypothetical protein
MQQLQARNPQSYQMINNAMQSGGNPQAMLQQMLSNATPDQRQQLFGQAKNIGVPEDILKQLQNK